MCVFKLKPWEISHSHFDSFLEYFPLTNLTFFMKGDTGPQGSQGDTVSIILFQGGLLCMSTDASYDFLPA